MLGKAEARQTASRNESPSKHTEFKVAVQPRSPRHVPQESTTPRPERSRDAAPQDQHTTTQQATGGSKDEQAQEESADDRQEPNNHAKDDSTPVQDAMVIAMNAPAVVAPMPTQGETNTEPGESATQETSTTKASAGDAGMAISATAASTTSTPMPTGAQSVAVPVSATTTVPTGEQQHVEHPKADTVPSESAVAASDVNPPVAPDMQTTQAAEPAANEKTDPDKVTSAVAAMTMMKREMPIAQPIALDNADRSTVIDALSQRQVMSGAQGADAAGQHLARDSGQFSDSSGEPNRSPANILPAGDGNNRTLFLDRMNGLGAATTSVNEGAAGGHDGGASPALSRALEAERPGEFHGTTPFTQSVTLDLDPLDMGPLRVRIMMNDQTVHAHIRTEHGELGQGLLQQGQSLESSLRTTGLEMGMLRVTVDQQQGRGDNAWMFQQQPQQQGRPSNPTLSQTASREEERGARGERTAGSNERVSFFA
ncbi:MAG: flagellar hook-length control protein FliK [Nitrospira sp.]|nr:flagellar hook-length control protein FliK [Nitrospira sp.]